MWWCVPLISGHRRLRQEDCQEFEFSLDYRMRRSKKKRKIKEKEDRKKEKSFYLLFCMSLNKEGE